MTKSDIRSVTLVDIILRRLSGNEVILDSEKGLTQDARGPNTAMISNIIFPRNLYTMVAESADQQIAGQFRHESDEPNAHIVYIAPQDDMHLQDSLCYKILDAMTAEAGKQGAHNLVAEVETNSPLFEVMRHAGFAVYSRQTIWHHDPAKVEINECDIELREMGDEDQIGVMALLASTVPTLLQQVIRVRTDMKGLVYRQNGRVEAYIAYSEGKQGIYIIPHIHPDLDVKTADILRCAVAHTRRSHKVPIYSCVRVYQEWMDSALESLRFQPAFEQALMVRHIAAGVRDASFDSTIEATSRSIKPVSNFAENRFSCII